MPVSHTHPITDVVGLWETITRRSWHVEDPEFGAVGDGIADDTEALMRAGRFMRAGGSLVFSPKTYKVRPDVIVMDFTGARGVNIVGNGAILKSSLVNPAIGGILIYAPGCDGLRIDNLNFIGGNTTLTPSTGERFLNFGINSRDIIVTNCTVKNNITGIQCLDNSTRHTGLIVLNCYFEKCFYPLSLWGTDDVFARIVTRNCGRSYFPVAPGFNHDVVVDSQSGYSSTDCLLKVYVEQPPGGETAAAARLREERNTLSDIKLVYRSAGRTIGAGAAGNGLVNVDIEQKVGASPSSGHFRNIDITFDVDGAGLSGNGADPFAHLVQINKLDSAGASEAVARGHTIRGLRVGGVAKNWNYSVGGGLVLCATAGSGFAGTQDWTGDQVSGLACRELQILGVPAADAIYANAQAHVSGIPFLTLENVVVDGTITYANIAATTRISEDNVKSSNVDATTGYGVWTPVDGSGAGLVLTVTKAVWTRRGRDFKYSADITYPVTASGANAIINGAPFASGVLAGAAQVTGGGGFSVAAHNGGTAISILGPVVGIATNANLSGQTIRFTISGSV